MSDLPATSREVHLARRPRGEPVPEDFELAEVPAPRPGEGEVLVRNVWMSVDPYMRGRMNDTPSYVPPFQIGQPLSGGAVGEVVASRAAGLAEGDVVLHQRGWRELAVVPAADAAGVDAGIAPLSAWLGALGMPGMTAYVGLLDLGRAEQGQTVFVSGAAGAVGSVAGQIARIVGCRVVGSAGSAAKVAWLRDDLGFDAAFDYHEVDLDDALRAACPGGVDVYFDNVGGDHLRAALDAMNPFGRIVLCGAISQYNAASPPPGPDNLSVAIRKRLTLRGFLVRDHMDREDDFRRDVARWLADGSLVNRETVVEGIDEAVGAFLGLFRGDNVGKMLVRLGPDPSRAGTSLTG